jgi:cyclophilin family peptidyl-prolyl cis-trans isomerase
MHRIGIRKHDPPRQCACAPRRDTIELAMRPIFALAVLSISCAWAQPAADLEAVVTTDIGAFRFEFAPDKAPKHVEHFLSLARQGYYDGSAFYRVMANATIQGGDPLLKNPKTPRNQWGTGGFNQLASEFSDLKHERGVVSTINIPGKANSDGAQFFVCVSQQPALDGKYSAFGRVTEGMDIVEKISQAPNAADGKPEKPVRILKVTIEKKRVEPFATASVEELRKTVDLKTTLGTIKIKMQPEWAPNHVRRFLMLVSTGWYNGTAFHRIVKGFVVQGGMGDTRVNGASHPSDRWVTPLKGEFRGDVMHVRGIVSMARGSEPDSATTSFFMMLGPGAYLNGQYSAFGQVVDGMDVLAAFENEEVGAETPKRRLEIIEAKIEP